MALPRNSQIYVTGWVDGMSENNASGPSVAIIPFILRYLTVANKDKLDT